MRFAVIKDNLVTNLIVAAEGQQAELETALGARLEDAAGYGLTMGDLWIPERGGVDPEPGRGAGGAGGPHPGGKNQISGALG